MVPASRGWRNSPFLEPGLRLFAEAAGIGESLEVVETFMGIEFRQPLDVCLFPKIVDDKQECLALACQCVDLVLNLYLSFYPCHFFSTTYTPFLFNAAPDRGKSLLGRIPHHL